MTIIRSNASIYEMNGRKRSGVVAVVVLSALVVSGAQSGWALAALPDQSVTSAHLVATTNPNTKQIPGSILPANVEQMRSAGVTEKQIKAISEVLFEYHSTRSGRMDESYWITLVAMIL